MQSRRDQALALAQIGLNIFPLPPRSKEPIKDVSWSTIMTTDPAQINAWFDETPDMNYGVNGGDKVAIVDLDEKNGKSGITNFTTLNVEQSCDDWCLNTFTVRSPSGGNHLYIRVPYAVANSASKIGSGIDIRGARGYVVGPGCYTEEVKEQGGKIKQYQGLYSIEMEAELAEAPQWLLDGMNRHFDCEAEELTPLIELDLPVNIARAREFLSTQAPANEGRGGDEWTFKTIAKLKDCGVSEETAFGLLIEGGGWNQRCEPPWTAAELAVKVQNVYRYGQNRPGNKGDLWDAPGAFKPEEYLAGIEQKKDCSPTEYPKPLSARELASGSFPRPEFLIEGVLLEQHVNLIYGNGGVGKTTLALNAAIAIAAGLPLFGRKTKQAPVLLALNEDGNGETKYRLQGICAHFGVSLEDLPLTTWCLPGYDGTLASVSDDGKITSGPFQAVLDVELSKMQRPFLVLDSLADIATLNESLRPPVNALLKRVLGRLCDRHRATILVPGHPSKSSIADGTHYSGSTAFNGGVRSRLVLEQPEEKSSRRLLKVAKANYGPKAEIELFLMDSVFVTASDAGQAARDEAEREAVLSVVLKMIDQGTRIVRSNGSGQKSKDVAAEVRKTYDLIVPSARVLDILNAAERQGVLMYCDANNKVRGAKAGFVRRPSP
jgi:hypothetical protein